MTEEELEQWQDEFDAFHARFADLFERSESREQARKYLRGLLTEAERKNSWQVAEAVALHMNGYKVVVTKSTVPTGTGKMIDQILREKNGIVSRMRRVGIPVHQGGSTRVHV